MPNLVISSYQLSRSDYIIHLPPLKLPLNFLTLKLGNLQYSCIFTTFYHIIWGGENSYIWNSIFKRVWFSCWGENRDPCQNSCQLLEESLYSPGDINHLGTAIRGEVFVLILWCFCRPLYKRLWLPTIIKITRYNVILTVVISHNFF